MAGTVLPDFRNLGVILRSLIIAEGTGALALVAYSPAGFAALVDSAQSGRLFETSLLSALLVLFFASPVLRRLPYSKGVTAVVVIVSAVSVTLDATVRILVGSDISTNQVLKVGFVAAALAALVLGYFDQRQRLLSPAVAESRLIALQARIRPHFLFNSLNAAISLLRSDPPRAEQVLLDLADLFRSALAENRLFVPLRDEIKLARSYLEIEQLRLGERLCLEWRCDNALLDAEVPFMMLQPLLENAVHHCVELSEHTATVEVDVRRLGSRIEICVSNPVVPDEPRYLQGNRMALANIQERLALHFDAEAEFRITHTDRVFSICIRLPLSPVPRA